MNDSNLLKSFRKIIREEIEAEGKNIRDEIVGDITQLKINISTDVGRLSDRVKNVEVKINNLESKMIKGFGKVNKNLEKSVNFLDRDHISLKKRVGKIEAELNLAV